MCAVFVDDFFEPCGAQRGFNGAIIFGCFVGIYLGKYFLHHWIGEHFLYIGNDICSHTWLQRPADYFTVKQIKYNRQIQPALVRP